MLDAGEAAHAGGDFRGGDTREKGGRRGGQYVFEIVLAAQPDIGSIQQHGVLSVAPKNDLRAPQIGATGNAFRPAEPENLRPRRGEFGCRRIVGIDDCGIALGLILKNTRFGPSVVFERSVPVEMIGSEVQQN